MAMQAQIQALIARRATAGARGAVEGSNTGFNIEVAKPLVLNGEAERVEGFIIACRLFLRIKIRGAIVEKQI